MEQFVDHAAYKNFAPGVEATVAMARRLRGVVDILLFLGIVTIKRRTKRNYFTMALCGLLWMAMSEEQQRKLQSH